LGCYHSRTRCYIGDRWNEKPELGTIKLAVYVAGNGNVLEDHVQHAEDAALLVKGRANIYRMMRPSRAPIYKTVGSIGSGRNAGDGDLVPLKRRGDRHFSAGTFGKLKSGGIAPGGSYATFNRLYDQELGVEEVTES